MKTISTIILSATISAIGLKANAQLISAGVNHTMYTCGTAAPVTTGSNTDAQQGDGTTTNRNVPGAVSGLTNVIAVAGGNHSLFVKSDGTVWSCGQNYSGQLGNGTNTQQNTPVQVN